MRNQQIREGILSAIGNTPLVRLQQLFTEAGMQWYGKLEMFNPGGSIKDRPAQRMLAAALEEGQLAPDATIIESSSGNMAVGLAQACRYLGLDLIIVADPKINDHTRRILKAYGARIEMVSEADAHGNYLQARLDRVKALAAQIEGAFWPNQYANEENPEAHRRTMAEIYEALPAPPDYLLASVSTCGTLMGCARYAREQGWDTRIVAVDAVGSVLFGAPPADRKVPGHGAGRSSELLDKGLVDRVLHISDEDSIAGCRRLLDREAILAGGSSGAVVAAAGQLLSEIDKGAQCALILPDSGERYLDTVYDDEWVRSHFGSLPGLNEGRGTAEGPRPVDTISQRESEQKTPQHTGESVQPRKVAIVGGGPKGLYAFERLAAQLKAHPPARPVEIHVFNRDSHFGAGQIYRPGQPAYLLMNNVAGDVNLWIDEPPPPVVPDTLALTEWLRANGTPGVSDDDFVSRADTGCYLAAGFASVAAGLPAGVRGQYLVAEVTDLTEASDGSYTLAVEAAGQTQSLPHHYEHVLLATGHPRNRPGPEERQYATFAGKRPEVGFVPFVYPVERQLVPVPPGSRVAMKGMGLTFVDAVRALTEGRGGRFEPAKGSELPGGELRYIPSGGEPAAIFPFSRSGLPMIPRGTDLDNPPLRFFTEQALDEIRQVRPGGGLDFQEDLWPLLAQEMIYTFYRVKLRGEDAFDIRECRAFDEVEAVIRAFHEAHPEQERFDPQALLNPLGPGDAEQGGGGDAGSAMQGFIRSYWDFFLAEAEKGEQQSPWAAVTGVWRRATPLFGRFYQFGGLTAESQRWFDRRFRRQLNRVTFGPPAESIRKMRALMETKILRFDAARSPEVQMDADTGTFMLHTPSPSIESLPVDFLIDARIDKVSVRRDQSPLYRNLIGDGTLSLFENSSGTERYLPGCVAITPEGFVIDAAGEVNSSVSVTGTPTEGATFDNDALSRTRNNTVSGWAAYICHQFAPPTPEKHVS